MDVINAQPLNYFPELSKKEILDCLAEMGTPLEPDELNEPHRFKDKIKSLFMALVQRGLHRDTAYFQAIPASALEKKREWNPYCELRDDAYLTPKFYCACKEFMTICGLGNDFGWRDLYAPTHKRLRHQLSAMINYFKFYEGKMGSFDQVIQAQEELFHELTQLLEENTGLLGQYEQAKAQAQIRISEKQDLETKCLALTTDIGQKNKLQASMRQESIALKKKANELKDDIALITLKLQEMHVEERKLNSQVVQSPDKIKQRMELVQRTLEEERTECAQQERAAAVSKVALTRITKAVQDGTAVVNQGVDLVIDEQRKYREVLRNIQNIQRNITNNDKECHGLKEKTELHEREIRIQEDKINHNRKQFKMKMDAMQHSMEAANAELFLVEKDRRDGMARIEAIKEEVASLESIIAQEQQKHEADIAEILDTFKRFEAQVMESDKMFLSVLSNVK